MAGHRDGDMRYLPIAHPRISRQPHVAFLVSRHDCRRYRNLAPQDLPFALSFRHQYRAVRLRELHHQRQLLSRSDCRTFRQAGLHGRQGSLGQVNPHPQLDLYRRTPAQRQHRGHRQAHRRTRAR